MPREQLSTLEVPVARRPFPVAQRPAIERRIWRHLGHWLPGRQTWLAIRSAITAQDFASGALD